MNALENLPLAVRVFGYFLVYVLIWCVWCLPPLLSSDHVGFQSAGTVIICWAIFFIGRDRLRFEKSISSSEHSALVAAVNRLEAHRAINEKRLDLTFNIHLLQISRLSQHAKIPNPLGPQSSVELDDFAKEIQQTIDSSPKEFNLDEEKYFADKVKEMHHARSEYGRWRGYAFRCEIGFLVVGTLQTGYGAAVSELLTKSDWIKSLNSLLMLN